MSWISVLENLAPTIASALGSPVAGIAISALESALGIQGSDNVQKTIEDGKLTGDQVASIQQAEIAVKAKAQELGLDFEQLAVTDRKSARDMEIATKSMVPPILATLIIIGFGIIIGMKIWGIALPTDPILQDLITTLRDAVILVLSFYFGSSNGSQNKDTIIHSIATKNGNN